MPCVRKTIALLLTACFLPGGIALFAGFQDAKPSPQIILDGPWSNPPAADAGQITLDKATGALTLPSYPSQLAFVALPDPDKDAFTNNIYSLGVFEDRLYPGYGDLYNNQGPLNLVSYNPFIGKLTSEMGDIPEDQFGAWLSTQGRAFYATGADARESWTFGNIYVNYGAEWRKLRTIYRGLHVNKLMEYSGRLYAAFSSDNHAIVDYPYILVSADEGVTWNYERLDNAQAQGCTVSQMAVVHAEHGDQLFVMAHVSASRDQSELQLYHLDGNAWEKVNFGKSSGEFRLLDIASLPSFSSLDGKLLVTAYTSDTGGRGWAAITYTWDGHALTEIPYLRGRNLDLSLFTEYEGNLYAMLNAAQPDPQHLTYELVRTTDLTNWESSGSLRLPDGVKVGALAFLHERLYVGGKIAWREIRKNPYTLTLEDTQTHPLENASILWDADLPAGSGLRFQVKAGRTYSEFLTADFVGPDGTPHTMFTESGQAFPPQLSGAQFVTVKLWKEAGSAGELPFVRTVTINSRQQSIGYAIDQGSGLYAAANVSDYGQFTSEVFQLDQPLADARLYFDARTPAGTNLSFQVRSGKTREDLEKAPFSGPDGSSASFYTRSGVPLWEGYTGTGFIQYRAILSSTVSTVAPFLRQVRLVNHAGALESLQLRIAPLTLTAGEPADVQVDVLDGQGQPLPMNGTIFLHIKSEENSGALTPDHLSVTNGSGKAPLTLLKAGSAQICANLSDVGTCSQPVTVKAGKAAYFDLQAPELKAENPMISPHAELSRSFSLLVTARDRYGNLAGDYTGTLSCASRSWEDMNPALIPAYAFTAQDQGSHLFRDAVSFAQTGEFSLVCKDNNYPSVGGALAVTVGTFNFDQFP